MSTVVVAIAEPRASILASELELEGVRVAAVSEPGAILPLPDGVIAVIAPGTRAVLSPALIAACDRAGVRIIPVGDGDDRVLSRYGLPPALPAASAGWEIAEALAADAPEVVPRPAERPRRVITIWGPAGAPGRSTLAVQLAVEISRTGRRTALIDADTVAPSIALLLGLGDDAPGIAAACRRAELGALDGAELTRLCSTIETSGGEIDVLSGINRPSRWPELSAARLRGALQACRGWADETIVDVAAAFDADEEATYDLVGPRRHAATMAALQEADAIVAVAAADPLGISRFLREHAELRRLTSPTPVTVVVNQVRPGPLGIDARGQIRRTLDRLAGITDVSFLPFDRRSTDAALLHAGPVAEVVPRSTLVAAVRRLATSLSPSAATTADSSRGSSPAARPLRRARAAREA